MRIIVSANIEKRQRDNSKPLGNNNGQDGFTNDEFE